MDPEIRGGEPIIKGTRLSIYSLLERFDAGDTLDDLVKDYPDLGFDTIEMAIIFAMANPTNGKPARRPWREHA